MAKRAWGGIIQGRDERRRLKRQAILASAASLIRRKSYGEMTLADVADDLNISKPTLYYYFKSKDRILFEIQRQAIGMLTDAEPPDLDSPFLPGLAPADRLARFIRRYVMMITSDFGACLIMTPRQVYEPATRKRLIEAIRPTDRLVMAIIEEGVRAGDFGVSDFRLATNFLFGALNWLPYWYRASGRASVDEIAATATDLILTGLRRADLAQAPTRARSLA